MSKTAAATGNNQSESAKKMLSYRWTIFGILALAYLFIIFHRLGTAVMASDLMQSFSIDAVGISLLGSMYFYPYAVMQLPAGIMADSIGPRKLATISFGLAGLGALLFSVAPNFPIAIIGRLLVGLGLSCVYVPTLKLFAIWFRRDEYATLTGMLVSVGNIGGLIASAPLAIMLVAFGWRLSVGVIAVITIVLAGIIYMIVRNSPQEMGYPTLDEIDGIPVAKREVQERVPVWQGIKAVLSEKYIWIMSVRSFTSYGVMMAFQSLWGGPYLMQILHLSKVQAGSILMMLSIGGIISSPLGGYLSDKVFKSRKGIALVSAALYTLCWIPLAFMPEKLSPQFLTLWLLLMSFIAGFGASAIALVKELFPSSLTGTVNGINNFFVMAGGAVFQVIVGIIIRGYAAPGAKVYPVEAFAAGFRFLFYSAIAGTIALAMMKETMHREPKPIKANAVPQGSTGN